MTLILFQLEPAASILLLMLLMLVLQFLCTDSVTLLCISQVTNHADQSADTVAIRTLNAKLFKDERCARLPLFAHCQSELIEFLYSYIVAGPSASERHLACSFSSLGACTLLLHLYSHGFVHTRPFILGPGLPVTSLPVVVHRVDVCMLRNSDGITVARKR